MMDDPPRHPCFGVLIGLLLIAAVVGIWIVVLLLRVGAS